MKPGPYASSFSPSPFIALTYDAATASRRPVCKDLSQPYHQPHRPGRPCRDSLPGQYYMYPTGRAGL